MEEAVSQEQANKPDIMPVNQSHFRHKNKGPFIIVLILVILLLVVLLYRPARLRNKLFPESTTPNSVQNTINNVSTAPHPTYGPIPTGSTTDTMNYGGQERTYIVHIPTGYNPQTAYPLVFVFHGSGGNAAKSEEFSNFSSKADQNGFVVIYPNGTGQKQVWDDTHHSNGVDDIGFVQQIITTTEQTVNIDPNKIYASGISNGGGFSYTLGCFLPNTFAALGVVSGGGIDFSSCMNNPPLPLVAFYGTSDTVVHYAVGQNIVPAWAKHNGCSTTPQTTQVTKDVSLQSYTSCTNNASVDFYTITGGVHTWPGAAAGAGNFSSPSDDEISATDIIWQFFSQHSK